MRLLRVQLADLALILQQRTLLCETDDGDFPRPIAYSANRFAALAENLLVQLTRRTTHS